MDIAVDDGLIIIRGGNKHPKKITRGWELITQMKEGFLKWVSLKDIDERNPVKLSEYAVSKKGLPQDIILLVTTIHPAQTEYDSLQITEEILSYNSQVWVGNWQSKRMRSTTI